MASKTASKTSSTSPAPKVRLAVKKAAPTAVKKLESIAKAVPVSLVRKPTRAKSSVVAKGKVTAVADVKKIKKSKLVRDSFTIPKDEYLALQTLKNRAIGLAKPVKKGELLRAGLLALTKMSDPAFLSAVAAIPSLKTGRPKSTKKNG